MIRHPAEPTVTRPRLPPASPAAIDVLTRILTSGPIPRVDIARQTGLSQAAVTKAVAPLVEAGFVALDGARGRPDAPGRPVTPLRVVAESVTFIGVKITADEAIGVATDFGATILDTEHRRMARHTPAQVVRTVQAVVAALVRRLGERAEQLVGIGVSVSGDVDTAHGIVRDSPKLGWHDVALRELLEERLDRPVRIDNDVHALTIAEQWFGVGAGDVDSFVIVTIGSGIGCGLYLNGDVVNGSFGVSGELGHLPLADQGLTCECGRVDCVETIASSAAIVRAVQAATGRTDLDMDAIVELAHAGQPDAVAAFDRAATAIGRAIAVVANLTGPEVAVIEGESVADFDVYETTVRKTFAAQAFGAAAQCRIELRPHTFDAWARGAAASVIRSFVRQEDPR
ncbi:MAG TPA: ROK family transcriptional regulator [Jatrophihabitantaceae bacterium]